MEKTAQYFLKREEQHYIYTSDYGQQIIWVGFTKEIIFNALVEFKAKQGTGFSYEAIRKAHQMEYAFCNI